MLLIRLEGIIPFFLFFILIVSLITFISNPHTSRDLTIFIIFSILSFKITNAFVRQAKSEDRLNP